MKAAYQALMVIIPIIVVVTAAAMLAVAPVSDDSNPDVLGPVPVEPDPVLDLPDGVTYDEGSHVLSYASSTEWHVFDMLHAYADRENIYGGSVFEAKKITLSPGKYSIKVNEESFEIVVPGKVSRTLSWDYQYDGRSYPVTVSYEIDIDEYLKITESSKALNSTVPNLFSRLPELVTVNDVIYDIESQLEKRYKQIGGSISDRQGYAEFLASMAQIPIEYPTYKSYGDMQIWGVEEYWQNSMETLYHMAGDCEDKAALACALFTAAGYKAAMCGVIGHVTAGIALDDFKERSEKELKDFDMDKWVLAADKDVTGQDTETIYYAVETIKEEQHYIGYLLSGSAKCISQPTIYWGMAGFYPVNLG